MQYDKQIVSSESFREYESAVSAAWSLFGVVASGGVPSVSEAAEVYSRLESFEDSGGLSRLYMDVDTLICASSRGRLPRSEAIFRTFSRSGLVEGGRFEQNRLLALGCFRSMSADEDESGVLSDFFQLSGELEEIVDFLCHFARVVRSWWGSRDAWILNGRVKHPFPSSKEGGLLCLNDLAKFFPPSLRGNSFRRFKRHLFRESRDSRTGRMKFGPRTSIDYCAICSILYARPRVARHFDEQADFDRAFCDALGIPRFRIYHSDERVKARVSEFLRAADRWRPEGEFHFLVRKK